MKALEQAITSDLKDKGILDEVQDLLACDMYYETAGLSMRQYRCMPKTYLLIREGVRAEVLEDGILSAECICLLWLFRETGVLHDIFTVSEQETVYGKLPAHSAASPVMTVLIRSRSTSNRRNIRNQVPESQKRDVSQSLFTGN